VSKDFINLSDLNADICRQMIDVARARKDARAGQPRGGVDSDRPLEGQMLSMIFDKPSTRTRLSFDLAMRQLGGQSIVLNQSDMQLGRGETVADTARVMSRFSDAVMIRTGAHETLTEFAHYASIPVINGLTALSHPCQIMADILTFEEHKGPIAGQKLAWFGDGNNVAVSFVEAAALFNFELVLAVPPEFSVPQEIIEAAQAAGAQISITASPEDAARGAAALITDCWVSMTDDPATAQARQKAFAPFQVTAELMALGDEAIFMHCLPAYRDKEVTTEVMESTQSVIFDEAENRLHAQKAILLYCLDRL
jgi:ornithine carbamoyltransferase